MISLGRKALSVAVASAMMMLSNANATGLGRLTVLSALGQPLRAEIELTAPDKEDIAALVPKLASADAFRHANIEFNPALLSLHFSIEQRGANYVIKVSSNQAMNEPFVDMLLELNSVNGKLLREYTFLLDPSELRTSQTAQVASPVAVAQPQPPVPATSAVPPSPVRQPTGEASTKPAPASRVRPARELPKPEAAAGDYRVKAGDTLSKIAGAHRIDGVSLDQMLVSLYRANPQAFVGNNMNRLKAGQILSVPDAEAIRSGAAGDAHAVVVAHAADFNAYRNKLAGQVAAAPAVKTASGSQSASGTITTKVKEIPTATSESPDKLKLSKVEPGAAAKNASGKTSTEEDRLAKDKAVADANARVKELEKNVGDLKKLLDINSKELAAKQASAKTEARPEPAKPAEPASVPSASAKVASVAPAAAPAASVASASAASASVSASVAASAASAASKPVIKRKPMAPPPPPPPEPSFFESLLNSGVLLPGIGAILALLAGYGIFTNYRKKKLQQFEDSILTGSSMKANSMFGSTGGQSVDTNNSVFNSNFAPSASQLDANEVDPVAEADVYIAYGRDAQAEEILKEALRTQPERHAVRVKLLEIYFARKDAKLFERLASELYGMTSGEGEEWAQAASMGIALEPNNPLYAGGKAKEVEAAAVSGLGSGTQPLEDLDPDALLANSLSRDMLEAISIIDTATGGSKAAAEPPAEDKHDLAALDFDLDIPSVAAEPEAEVPQIPEPAAKSSRDDVAEEIPAVDFGAIDFNIGKAEPAPVVEESPVIEEEAMPEPPAAAELEMPALDFPSEPEITAAAVVEEDSHPAEPDLAGIELAEEAAPAESPVEAATEEPVLDSAAAFEFDLSGIDLDLEPHLEAQPAQNAEMSTKLDLAIAYHEIGDKEGARELLDEVLKGGTAEQIERAKSLLAQLE